MDKYLLEFALGEEAEESIVVEVDGSPPKSAIDDRISISDNVAHKAKQSFESALTKIKPVANAVISKVKELNEPADEVEVKFGLKMSAEFGAVVASGNADVNYEITLKWNHK